MRNFIFLLALLLPMLLLAQIEKTIKLKVAMMQNFVHKAEQGETAYWQTKGKVTYKIVNYTNEQNQIFKDLFIKQYQELLPIYNRMVVSEDEKDTNLFIKTLIKHEEEYRNLLTAAQLNNYKEALATFEKTDQQNFDAYLSLFFTDALLKEFKEKF